MTRDEEIELAWKQRDADSYFARQRARRNLRNRLAEAQNWRCCHCGSRMDGIGLAPDAPSLEHIIPIARGGDDSECNLAVCHNDCNRERGDRWHEAELLVNQSASDAYCAVSRWIRNRLSRGRIVPTNEVLDRIPSELPDEERNVILQAMKNLYGING